MLVHPGVPVGTQGRFRPPKPERATGYMPELVARRRGNPRGITGRSVFDAAGINRRTGR